MTMFTETVAVVGGAGFLGRHVVAALEAAGYQARALSRRSGFNALNPDSEAFRGCAAVLNLAGIKREEHGQTFDSIHVALPQRLIEAMRQAGLRRLIHISVVVARPAPDLPYHDTKWKGEQVVRASGLDWTILRPGVIYGEGDDMLSHLVLMIRAASIFPGLRGIVWAGCRHRAAVLPGGGATGRAYGAVDVRSKESASDGREWSARASQLSFPVGGKRQGQPRVLATCT